MVVQLKRGSGQSLAFDTLLSKLDPLVVDMKALRDGRSPLELGGTHAPLLDRRAPRLGPSLFLVGHSTGHPKFAGEDQPITASQVFIVSEDQAWARTLSRWYRLGLEVTRTELDS